MPTPYCTLCGAAGHYAQACPQRASLGIPEPRHAIGEAVITVAPPNAGSDARQRMAGIRTVIEDSAFLQLPSMAGWFYCIAGNPIAGNPAWPQHLLMPAETFAPSPHTFTQLIDQLRGASPA